MKTENVVIDEFVGINIPADAWKKPTMSVYDTEKNCETKVASFNSQETFEWFINTVLGGKE